MILGLAPVDDGSAVVACFLQHVYDPLTEEEKKEQVEAIRNRRELPERIGHPPESISIPEIGSVVKVTGKVQKWRKEERSIRIDDIGIVVVTVGYSLEAHCF